MELYGRADELDDIAARLDERRLVTIVGAGGVGKTALAREAARRLGGRFACGACHVDLTRIDRPEAVAEAVAGQLGFADLPSLLDSPGDQPALVVVDNCEHVLDAAADVIARLLESCEMPRVLATSRSALDLDGESIVGLGPLSPPSAGVDDPEVPAIRLFRARGRDHGVVITDDDLPLAADICRRLDGVPLAIELAAARLRAVGPAEVVRELDAAPHALARRRHRGQAHHRSVGDLVAWSYELLDPVERRVFRHLGVFAGPFTRDLARSVIAACALDTDTDTDTGGVADQAATDSASKPDASGRVDAAIDALIDASLIAVDRSGEQTRYRLLHPIRAVAIDLLERQGEADRCRNRLVDEICERTVAIVRGGPQGWDSAHLHGLIDLYDHAAGSIRWLVEHDDRPDRALTLVAVLWGIVHNAHSDEIHALGESVLARWPDPSAARWPHAVATVSTCRFLAGDTDGAIRLAESALGEADRSRAAPSLLRRVIAQSRRAAGDIDGAVDAFREAADVARDRGAHGLYLELRVDEGLAMVERGDSARGLAMIEQIAVEAAEASAPINVAWARVARASVLRRFDARAALPVIEAALAESRAIDYPAGITFALRLLAAARLELGETEAPAELLLELLDALLQRGGLDEMRVVLDLTAELMRRHEVSGWPDLAATAASLPVTSFITPTSLALLPADRPTGAVLPTRDAYVLARRSLLELVPNDEADGVSGEIDGGRASDGAVARSDDPDRSPEPEIGSAAWVCEGDVWRITFEGATVRLRRSKGLDDLARLLAASGREIAALDLASGGTAGISGGAAEAELLDAAARRRYESRIRDIQSELAEAEDHHDFGRAELLQAELDALVDQLTEAVGLGGRTRRTTGAAERARSAVTQRIRGAIRRIGDVHASLGDHLDRSVSTGILCSYDPRPAIDWTIEQRGR